MNFFRPFFPLFQAITLALFMAVGFSGCDKIKGPYKEKGPDNTDTTQAVRKVLLEEFTGHQCGNCPEGAELAHELKEIYGDRLILMSIHAGFFAQLKPSDKYTYDFRTPTGNAIEAEYTVIAYPSAIINRTNHEIFGKSAWATVIDTILSKPPQAKISITPELNSETRELKLDIKTTFVEPVAKPQNLSVFLVESGKISWQKDYRLPTGQQDIENYSHDHFLRAALTGTWGDLLTSGPVAANEAITRQFTYQIPAEFNMAKCKVIAVVNDPVNFRIMQAEESGYLQ